MKKIIILWLMLFPQAIFSQEKQWTLDDCMQYAVMHNLQRARQEAQNEIYRQDQREAVGGFLPSLSASTNASVNFGRGVDPETNTYISTNTFGNAYDLSASMTLFDGLAQIYRVKMAKINRLRGDNELQDTKNRIALDIMELFFNVLYYRGTVELAGQQLEESVANLNRFRRMEELGLKSIPDLAEIQAKEAEDRFLLTKQTNLFRLEVIKLKEKMNLPVEEDLSVAGYEKDTLAVSRDPESAMDIYQQALLTLPKALAAGNALSATEMQYKIARGRLFPVISLGAGFSTGFSHLMDGSPYMPFREQLKNRQGSYAGVSLSIPLFDRFSRSSELKRSRQRWIIARNEHEETLRQVYSEIEQAVADVDGLSDEYRHAFKRTEAMLSAHQMNLRKYEKGLIDAIELSASANRLLNSRVEELHTHLKYQLKCRLLDYYKGLLMPAIHN